MPQLEHRLLRGNDISYGVYIYHGLLINLFVEMEVIGSVETLMLVMGCTYLIAYVSWIAVERPFLRRKEQTISPTLALSYRSWWKPDALTRQGRSPSRGPPWAVRSSKENR